MQLDFWGGPPFFRLKDMPVNILNSCSSTYDVCFNGVFSHKTCGGKCIVMSLMMHNTVGLENRAIVGTK